MLTTIRGTGWRQYGSSGWVLTGSVHIGSMVDPKDDDCRGSIVDFVHDAVGASPGGPQSCEFALQWVADAARVLTQRSDHELDNGSGHTFGEASKLTLC